MQQTNNENSTNLKIVMTFGEPPDLAIAQRALDFVRHQTNSPKKKLSTEESLTRKRGISKDLIEEKL